MRRQEELFTRFRWCLSEISVGERGSVRKPPSTDSIGFRSIVLPAACWDASVGAQRAAPFYQDALVG